MKEQIREEKAGLQAIFEPFNERGSWIEMRDGRERFRLGLIDHYEVTRLAPELSAAGEIRRIAFWLLFRAVGYHDGFQHAHTIKVVRWSQDDGYLFDLVDDRGRRFHAELIFPELEPELAADWKRWQRYKAENREMFDRIDDGVIEEHVRIAETWE